MKYTITTQQNTINHVILFLMLSKIGLGILQIYFDHNVNTPLFKAIKIFPLIIYFLLITLS